ncbi:MAG: hypothetical protein U0Q16_30130 [Bryobacteraceae bacterium]
MSNKLTRRSLAAAVLAASAPAPAQTQNPPAEELERARDGVRRNREALAKFKIDRAVEPAFQFKPL